MAAYPTLFLTERGLHHQEAALAAAPDELNVRIFRQPNFSDLEPYLPDTAFIISERVGAIGADLLKAAPKLRLIVRLGSLAHDIDLEAARERAIPVVLWPVLGSIHVAEHTVMQMLALSKRLMEVAALALAAGDWGPSRRTNEDTFAYNWTGLKGIEGLWEKTIGILGFGEIGAELARRLHGWGCRVLYHRRRRLPSSVEESLGISYAEPSDILARSDFLVNLLPYFPETDHALGVEEIDQMKPGAFVVSCGSGSVIDEEALAAAIRSGHLAGAALDTFEWEPLTAGNPLRLLSLEGYNVLLTPHTAAGAPKSASARPRAWDYVPIMKYLRGEELPYRLV